MLRDAKTTSELLMVVDMVRHDLARVCDGVNRASVGLEPSGHLAHQLMHRSVAARLKATWHRDAIAHPAAKAERVRPA